MQIIEEYADNAGFKPIRAALEAGVSAVGRPTATQFPGVLTAVWEGPPGTYEHPGAEHGEIFLVTEGEASMTLAGLGTFELRPHAIVTMPPKTPCTLVIRKTLRKFAVVPSGAIPA